MAELTPLDENLGEVLGLAQAAQDATEKVGRLAEQEEIAARLEQMHAEAEETERRTLALVERLEGKKTAIREKGRETKGEAAEMMKIYLGDDADGARRLRVPHDGGGRRARPLGDRADNEPDRG